jgi:hypothetical protein
MNRREWDKIAESTGVGYARTDQFMKPREGT